MKVKILERPKAKAFGTSKEAVMSWTIGEHLEAAKAAARARVMIHRAAPIPATGFLRIGLLGVIEAGEEASAGAMTGARTTRKLAKMTIGDPVWEPEEGTTEKEAVASVVAELKALEVVAVAMMTGEEVEVEEEQVKENR